MCPPCSGSAQPVFLSHQQSCVPWVGNLGSKVNHFLSHFLGQPGHVGRTQKHSPAFFHVSTLGHTHALQAWSGIDSHTVKSVDILDKGKNNFSLIFLIDWRYHRRQRCGWGRGKKRLPPGVPTCGRDEERPVPGRKDRPLPARAEHPRRRAGLPLALHPDPAQST